MDDLKAVIEAARHDRTIPTFYPSRPDCDTCKDEAYCQCWSWQDEAEWRHEFAKRRES